MLRLLALAAVVQVAASLRATPLQAELISVEKIWGRAPHNGFTDLVQFHDRFFCCFREGLDHVGGDGVIRILSSQDGGQWIDEASISEAGSDLRESKLAVTPDGTHLYLSCEASIYGGTKVLKARHTSCSTSADGKVWTATKRILGEGVLLWRVVVNPADKKFYGISDNIYPKTGGPKPENHWSLATYSSRDGFDYQREVVLQVPGQPCQPSLRFLQDGSAMALVRRDDGDRSGMIGIAVGPYVDWKWTSIHTRIAGPNFIQLPDGELIAGSRAYGKKSAETHVVLSRMTATSLDPILHLPSSGNDCGYTGFVWHDGILWVTYNSSHEDKTSVYLAKVRLAGGGTPHSK
jgi:hypothetical protein